MRALSVGLSCCGKLLGLLADLWTDEYLVYLLAGGPTAIPGFFMQNCWPPKVLAKCLAPCEPLLVDLTSLSAH